MAVSLGFRAGQSNEGNQGAKGECKGGVEGIGGKERERKETERITRKGRERNGKGRGEARKTILEHVKLHMPWLEH